MPLPWTKKKNSKVGRISRMVADLQSPTTRGNSLVVETGFPTSLIDLFVKNRDRLKKPIMKKKKKKQQKLEEQERSVIDEVVISDPILLSASKDVELLISPACRDMDAQVVEILEEEGERRCFDACDLVSENSKNFEFNEEECIVNNGRNHRRVLVMAVLKMFMVVVLGLSAKKLVVGLTMSAFLLIFLEYAGKHFWCFLKPCSNARVALEPSIRMVLSLFQSKRCIWISIEAGDCKDLKKGLVNQEGDCCDLVDPDKEIKVVESSLQRVAMVDESREVDANLILISCDQRLQCSNTETKVGIAEVDGNRNGSGVMACEKDCSQSSKIKRKMIKKLVPKQWLCKKKGKKGKERELDSISKECRRRHEDKLGRSEVLEGQENGDKGCKALVEHKKEELDHEILVSGKELRTKKATVANKERLAMERKGNSRFLVLLLVVLAGLVGGRILAFVLTVAVCMTFKIIRRHRRCVTFLS